MNNELIEALTIAGNKFDGHVTRGSLNAMIEVIEEAYCHMTVADIRDFMKYSKPDSFSGRTAGLYPAD